MSGDYIQRRILEIVKIIRVDTSHPTHEESISRHLFSPSSKISNLRESRGRTHHAKFVEILGKLISRVIIPSTSCSISFPTRLLINQWYYDTAANEDINTGLRWLICVPIPKTLLLQTHLMSIIHHNRKQADHTLTIENGHYSSMLGIGSRKCQVLIPITTLDWNSGQHAAQVNKLLFNFVGQASLNVSSEEQLLRHIKSIVVKTIHKQVHRLKFGRMGQSDRESIARFVAHLKTPATLCQFTVRCRTCNPVSQCSYAEYMVSQQLVAGLRNQDHQAKILAEAARQVKNASAFSWMMTQTKRTKTYCCPTIQLLSPSVPRIFDWATQ